MQISWYGLSCFKIQSTQSVLITDPIDPKSGLRLPKTAADIVVLTQPENALTSNTDSVSGTPYRIDGPGEFEIKGIFTYGIGLDDAGTSMVYKFLVDDISVGFVGGLNRELNTKELEMFESVDILIVPVGGHGQLTAKLAAEVIGQIEPRVVIPMAYSVPGLKTNLDALAPFLKMSIITLNAGAA